MKVAFPPLQRGLVAILRGIRPEEAVAVATAVHDAGIEAIEIPLNSPRAFESIAALVAALPSSTLIGAGTVLTEEDVDNLHTAGGKLLVSPNIDAAVMRRAASYRMVTMPGVFSPTEAFSALQLGASALKFFPASVMGPKGIAAMRAVLPADAVVGVVGGVSDSDFAAYAAVGVRTFGLGSSLYKPGETAAAVGEKARAAVAAWDVACGADRP